MVCLLNPHIRDITLMHDLSPFNSFYQHSVISHAKNPILFKLS